MRARRKTTCLMGLAFGLVFSNYARADENEALAETLFREGRAQLSQGNFGEACPKLAESQRLDPAEGTLLALAMCHEGEGKLAQAWTEYSSLAGRATTRADRHGKARERLAVVEPQLARLAIVVPEKVRAVPGLEVLRDGTPIGSAAWGMASPVEPGVHVIEARAPGHLPRILRVEAASGSRYELVVDRLEPSRRQDRPATPALVALKSTKGAADGTPLRVAGIAVGAAGVVAVGIGGAFGLQALEKSNQAKGDCPTSIECSPRALALNDDAKHAARVANITAIGGLVGIVGGLTMVVLAPRSRVVLAPHAGQTGGGATFAGSF